MENINKTYKNILKKGIKLSTFLQSNLSMNKINEKINFNFKSFKKSNLYLTKKHKKISKNAILTINDKKPKTRRISYLSNLQKDFSLQYPSSSRKSAIIQLIKKNNSDRNMLIKKTSTQNDFYNLTKRKIPNIKSNFFKNLIENIPTKNNLKDIDYILESPYRGVEKIRQSPLSKSVSNKNKLNFYKSIYINNNYKGYFCLKKPLKSKSYFPDITNLSIKKDKYIDYNKNKEIDNPLEKISKMSGVSCYKLRQAINYSLKHNLKDLTKNFKYLKEKKINNKINKYKYFLPNNRYKNIYSIISLKSKLNHKYENIINENSIDLDNDDSLENVIYSKRRNYNNYNDYNT